MVPVTYATQFQSRSRRSSGLVRIGFLSARMIGMLLLALFALLYIAQSSQGATKRIAVQQYRSQADELNYEEDQLRIEANRLQSLDTITQAAPTLGLEPVTDVEHIK